MVEFRISNKVYCLEMLLHVCRINRGSYMSAHVLMNLLNELGKINNVRLAEHFIYFSQRV